MIASNHTIRVGNDVLRLTVDGRAHRAHRVERVERVAQMPPA
jgi:hypothetical protein